MTVESGSSDATAAFDALEGGVYAALETYSNVHRGSGHHELVVLDGMGHGEAARRQLARASGHPEISAQSITARVAGALIAHDRRQP